MAVRPSSVRPRPLLAVLTVAGVGLLPSPGSAQPTIASDRPGLGSSSAVIDPGYLQFEIGGEYADGDSDLHYAEAGAAWLRNDDLQFDVNGGVEVDGGGWFVGIGVAKRWRGR